MDERNSILFLGDVVPYKPFKYRNKYPTVINLECPITKDGNPVSGKINLNANENYLNNIFNNNLFCVNLSNNHILDYGKKGLESTLTELEKLKIKWFGLNDGSVDNCNPLITEKNKIKIAFYAAVCPSTSPVTEINNTIYLSILNVEKIINSIQEIKDLVQRIVIYIHWGVEESSYPSIEDIIIARRLIDAGADILIGSHAHAPQPIEKYKNGIIAYNLGNFIMPAMKDIPTYFNESGIPNGTYSKNLMVWNRISWGLLVDMNNLDFRIKKYIFIFNRIFELPFTTLDKYIQLNKYSYDISYELTVKKHLKKRTLYRRIHSFIIKPYIPNKLKNMLWK